MTEWKPLAKKIEGSWRDGDEGIGDGQREYEAVANLRWGKERVEGSRRGE